MKAAIPSNFCNFFISFCRQYYIGWIGQSKDFTTCKILSSSTEKHLQNTLDLTPRKYAERLKNFRMAEIQYCVHTGVPSFYAFS